METKGKLYQYKGGGYSGCFWEWNYAAVVETEEGDQEFHDIYSSGRNGCHAMDDLKTLKADTEEGRGFYTYDMTASELARFARESNAGQVLGVAKYLYNELGIEIMGECKECGQESPICDMIAGDISGAGGIMQQANALYCHECHYGVTDSGLTECFSWLLWDIEKAICLEFPELEELDIEGEALKAAFDFALEVSGGSWGNDGEGVYPTLDPENVFCSIPTRADERQMRLTL